jgi:hypothetical protein
MRIDIQGGWIELREPEAVPERLRRPVLQQSVKASQFNADSEMDAEALDFFSAFNDLLAIALIESWSFSAPVSVDGLLDLPGPTYDAIREAVTPLLPRLMPDFSVTDDPKVPTEQSDV